MQPVWLNKYNIMESMIFFCRNEKYITYMYNVYIYCTMNVGGFKKENQMGCGDILWQLKVMWVML